MIRLRDLQKPRGGETNVNPSAMDDDNRREWLAREAELIARLRAEFADDPEMQPGETSSSGESWPAEDRRTGGRVARGGGTKARLLAVLDEMVGAVVSSGDLGRAIGDGGSTGVLSKSLKDLAKAGRLKRVGYGRWLVEAAQ